MARVLEATATLIPGGLDRDGLAIAQTVAGPANLILNGAGTGVTIAAGVATFGIPRPVSVFAVSDESAKTFTITGTDRNGIAISEVLTGPGAGATVSTQRVFKTVSQIAVSAALTGNVEAGWTATSISRWIFIGNSYHHCVHKLRAFLKGTATYSIQGTHSKMNARSNPQNATKNAQITNSYNGGDYPDDVYDVQASGSTAVVVDLAAPPLAVRLVVTAQNADVVLRVIKSITG